MEPKIIFEDEEILVLDKPSGITVNRSETTVREQTVQDWVEKKFKVQPFGKASGESSKFKVDEETDFYKRAGIVHRIDKETSGILLAAKTPVAFLNLQAQFKERKVKKTYVALVHGKVDPKEGDIKAPIGRLSWNRTKFGVIAGGREAITEYKVIRYFEVGNEKLDSEPLMSRNQDIKKSSSRISHFSLLEIFPKTGRTHQIRVHLKYANHPIFGDFLYAGGKTSRSDRKFLLRVFLHAAKISFLHPKTNELIFFESLLPLELSDFLKSLNS